MNYQMVPLSAGLYFVGVPIGTARDITLRALDVLASADVLAAEDTRSLRKLMDIHGVPLGSRRIVALHDHSGADVAMRLVEAVKEGKSVAYASEAGMPLIADPGFELSRLAVAEGINPTCAPGPSAVLTALALGGLPTDAFFFAGFLPNTTSARATALEKLKDVAGTLVFYESPKRLGAMLRDAASVLGDDRSAAVCRELTKKFEEVRRGSLKELSQIYEKLSPKGEIVVLVDRGHSETVKNVDIETSLRAALKEMSVRDAADMVSQAHDLPRRKVYQIALSLDNEG
ncbi:16S rRNA (cytidine(1402)-2'-O)-methyltransferase [Sulfitobacter sp. M57]|uniref:16S rRNA (cytidine(1402)-2'-O)-methyltransferase n=1 Tax=unclassified Sulfitobacter TaxID=196795 RepID=UPI0023E25E07|nr:MULTISPECIES: 16S rRNA (cytidine(1402)-2'-O)-methyltransferase [unclassified Sulfitobacter]MDF3414564.1 16S rRNA (cytidine(1402)-2'-O)-methyltransferase [Sulfitobacter sp. KE5]MDF3422045.1 16S rRNA (cytidine(1402)-2'-O)-methyltransferase [Sulfitobacter sp. KE43]MDF3433110.1 16S rRNA (cytidine(1402)-2'-O)-methyltransferase [Sulfitobacter sp. KE42]MDF3458750.1 16S rRNA (cytidine(1402)-2'-O)-methyltransferase [Sulfitobacter sp. S74]MDF3462650.1 16S rRNA (cytidine(1402)-2'-O)-methyltransferase 